MLHALLYVSGSMLPKQLQDIAVFERLSPGQIKRCSESRLKALLLYAYREIPYYHGVLAEAGVVSDEEVRLENFNRIPVLTRGTIMKENILGRGLVVNQEANRVYFNWLHGNSLYDPELIMLNTTISPSLRQRVFNQLCNRTYLSTDNPGQVVARINSLKPRSIWSDAEALGKVIGYAKNKPMHSPEFIAVISTVLAPELREDAEATFKCPVYHQYSSEETGPLVITYSPELNANYFPWSHCIETARGGLLVTTLTKPPLIRYKIEVS